MRVSLVFLVFLLAGAGAWADAFVEPPETNWPYAGDPWYNPWVIPFPYQRNINWTFDNASAPLVPVYEGLDDDVLKDSDFIQLSGVDLHTFETDPTGTTQRVGFLGLDNRQGSTTAEGQVLLHLDNWQIANPFKHVWIEIGFLASADVGLEPSVKFPDGFGIVAADQWLTGPLADNGYRVTIPMKIAPNPPWEEFTLSVQAAPGNYLLVDYAHIATECVPEPGTVALVTLGTALVALRRNRRTLKGRNRP